MPVEAKVVERNVADAEVSARNVGGDPGECVAVSDRVVRMPGLGPPIPNAKVLHLRRLPSGGQRLRAKRPRLRGLKSGPRPSLLRCARGMVPWVRPDARKSARCRRRRERFQTPSPRRGCLPASRRCRRPWVVRSRGVVRILERERYRHRGRRGDGVRGHHVDRVCEKRDVLHGLRRGSRLLGCQRQPGKNRRESC